MSNICVQDLQKGDLVMCEDTMYIVVSKPFVSDNKYYCGWEVFVKGLPDLDVDTLVEPASITLLNRL